METGLNLLAFPSLVHTNVSGPNRKVGIGTNRVSDTATDPGIVTNIYLDTTYTPPGMFALA